MLSRYYYTTCNATINPPTDTLIPTSDDMIDLPSYSNSSQVMELSKWLACVYRSLDDLQDNSATLNTLRHMKIIPLSTGELVSLEDVTVFLLADGQSGQSRSAHGGGRDPLIELKKDLNLVHEDLTSTPDAEVNSQVAKLLVMMNIKQLTAQDLISCHIIPALKSDSWKVCSKFNFDYCMSAFLVEG